MRSRRTTLMVPCPEAEPLISHWRRKYDWSARRGVPAHVTVFSPFLPAQLVDQRTMGGLAEALAQLLPPAFELRAIRRLPGVIYLSVRPNEPLGVLTDAVAAAFPRAGRPARRGRTYHLTVGRGMRPLLYRRVARDVRPQLPLRVRPERALLLDLQGGREVRTLGEFRIGDETRDPTG